MEHWKITKLRFMKRNLVIVSISFLFFFFFSTCALFGTINFKTATEIRVQLTSEANFYLQKVQKNQEEMKIEDMSKGIITSRRLLGGPGSWPPRCTSKCGRCTPCRPVHVPVPPGTPVTAEYYPEAWRCKCGNKLYMP